MIYENNYKKQLQLQQQLQQHLRLVSYEIKCFRAFLTLFRRSFKPNTKVQLKILTITARGITTRPTPTATTTRTLGTLHINIQILIEI